MKRCAYCGQWVDYDAHLPLCPIVRLAFDDTFSAGAHAFTAEPLQAKPCASPDCGEPRWHATPYCQAHRQEIVRASYRKSKPNPRKYERKAGSGGVAA